MSRRSELGQKCPSSPESRSDQLLPLLRRSPVLSVAELPSADREQGGDRSDARGAQLHFFGLHTHVKLPCLGVELDAKLRVDERIPLGSVLLALEEPLLPRARRRPPVSRRDFDLHDVPIAVDEAEGHPVAGRVDAIRRRDEAPLEGKPVLMRMVVATELGSAEQKGSGRAARSRKTRERVGVDPDHEGIDDFPVDILEVTLRLAGVAVDVEGDKEGAECPPLVAGVDPGPFTVAPIRQGCREATLLVPDVLASQAGDEDKGFSWVSLGDAEIVRAGT